MEMYFEFKWNENRNAATEMENDRAILMQLPSECQRRIFSTFLFGSFMHVFRKTWTFVDMRSN